MANPNKLDDIFDVQVNISEETASVASFSNPLLVATFAATPSFPDRVREYTGNASQIKALLVADGFAAGSVVYEMVSRVVDQKGATRTVYVGRRDPADADLVAALNAIVAVNDEWYHVTADPDATTSAEHNAASAWMESQFGLYHIQTDSAAVYNNTPGNLAATVLAAQRGRTSILWHDPAAASGYGPAILRSDLATFSLPNGSTVQLRINGGATQVFTFPSTAATVTGSNTEPFAVTDLDAMTIAIDGGTEQVLTVSLAEAEVTCANAETYNFTNGMNLLVRRNGGAAQNVVFNGTAGDVDTAAEPYAPVAATTTFVIDGGVPQVVDWTGVTTAAQAKTALDAQLTGVTTAIIAGPAVRITSNRLGTSSDVEITANAGNALAEFGLAVGNNVGTGFAAFLDAATAAEVAAEINADTANVVASDSSGRVKVASDTEGTSSKIQITGGSANAVLGFDTNEYSGSGDFADGSSVSAAQMATWINNESFGLTATTSAGAVVLTSDTSGSASEIERVSGTLLTTLGFTVASTLGSGFAANAAAAEASEVATLISLTLTDASSSSASNRVVITSTAQGASASVEAVGGSALASLFSGSDFASGTGVQQDYAMCAAIGYGCSIRLDSENGNRGWDNAGNLVGAYGLSPLTTTVRERLHETLRCNTYEQRQKTRAEFHDGIICRSVNGLHRYIDQAISADWMDARVTEAFKQASDTAADQLTAIPLTDEGLQTLGQLMLDVAFRAAGIGHTIYDSSTIDPTKSNDTGVFIPRLIDLTAEQIDLRRPEGFRLVQRLRNEIQGAVVSITLTNVVAGT